METGAVAHDVRSGALDSALRIVGALRYHLKGVRVPLRDLCSRLDLSAVKWS